MRDLTPEQIAAALPSLLELAYKVARDYPDAADWKDARGELWNLARHALWQAELDEDDEAAV